MTTSDTKSNDSATQGSLPLFYKKPVPLRAGQHSNLRLLLKPDFRFAAHTNSVPIMASEFPSAARFYPIVFAGKPLAPVAVLGLERDNLFVGEDGLWQSKRTYIPAYVRRYPFTFITQSEQTFMLGVDLACERVVTEEGEEKTLALFADGKPTALTDEALKFCGALQTDHMATRAFAAALEEQNLLIDSQAKASLAGGRKHDLTGFRVIDINRFHKLPDAVVVDWHRKGWLALIHAHLLSQACWQDLLDRAETREAAVAANA
jgi:SapC